MFRAPKWRGSAHVGALTTSERSYQHGPNERLQYITPRTELFTIADLSRVWILADIYEYELPWVELGDEGQISVSAVPDRTFAGNVSYIYPTVDMKTRTVKVRFEVDNPGLVLKPGVFANVTLRSNEQPNAVVIPEEAVIRSGPRSAVFIVREGGKFEPRDVTLGIAAEGYVQVLDGLDGSEEVVTSAQFLIDSESKLREAATKMLDAGNQPPAAIIPETVESDNQHKMDGHDRSAH